MSWLNPLKGIFGITEEPKKVSPTLSPMRPEKIIKSNNQEEPLSEFYIKIVVLGATGTGKSTLLKNYTKRKISLNVEPTIGLELSSCTLKRKALTSQFELPLRVMFWDVPHTEILKNNTLEDVDGVVLTFDITNSKSIQAVDQWRSKLPKNIPIVLIGNKMDKKGHVINQNGIDAYVKDAGLSGGFQTCALGIEIREPFDFLIDRILASWLKKYNGLYLERIPKNAPGYEFNDGFDSVHDSDTSSDVEHGDEQVENVEKMNDSSQDLNKMKDFIVEMNEFYEDIGRKCIKEVLSELNQEWQVNKSKLEYIKQVYSEQREHSSFRQFFELKREFVTIIIPKWKRIVVLTGLKKELENGDAFASVIQL
jgi:small GTP-binding protein